MQIHDIPNWAAEFSYWIIYQYEDGLWYFRAACDTEKEAYSSCMEKFGEKVVKVDFSFI